MTRSIRLMARIQCASRRARGIIAIVVAVAATSS